MVAAIQAERKRIEPPTNSETPESIAKGIVDKHGTSHPDWMSQAITDALRAQQQRIAELEDGLRPFARVAVEVCELFHPHSPELRDSLPTNITLGHCRQAAALLKKGDAP